MFILKGCEYCEVNFQFLKEMKQLPCIKQYVLGQGLKTITTMTNNTTYMSFNDSLMQGCCFICSDF